MNAKATTTYYCEVYFNDTNKNDDEKKQQHHHNKAIERNYSEKRVSPIHREFNADKSLIIMID